MRDYLLEAGMDIDPLTVANVLRTAFSTRLIEEGDDWFLAMRDRNVTSHEYDENAADRVFASIGDVYLPMLLKLEATLDREHARDH